MDTILVHGVEMAIKKVILRMKALLGDSVIDSGGWAVRAQWDWKVMNPRTAKVP